MSSQYFPPYGGTSETVKVQLDLTNYATKDGVKNITHVDASSFASKTNLAALKSEVDKLHTDKLKTVPDDLAKLSNVVNNDVVMETEFNKLKSDVDAIDLTVYAPKTSVTALVRDLDDRVDAVKKDVNDLNDTIDGIEKKIPDVTGLASKLSITALLPTSAFNSKILEIENKITAVENKVPDVACYVKKSGYANDITAIKNDYVTNASLSTQLNNLKSQHIAIEVKSIDDKTKENASDILAFENRLKQKEDIIDEVQRDNALTSGRDYYRDEMYLLYKCRVFSFKHTGDRVNLWKSRGLNNYTRASDMDAVAVSNNDLPSLVDNGRMSVKFAGAYFKQTKLIRPNNNNAVNVYIAHQIDPISNFRNTDYTVQYDLFGGVKITKNATDTSKHKYEGYGICFDEGGTFSKSGINSGRNVLIVGVHKNSLVHANNKANNIYVMGDFIVQGINDTTLYAEKLYSQNFTAVEKKLC